MRAAHCPAAAVSAPSATATDHAHSAEQNAMTENHKRTRGSPGLSARKSAIARLITPPMNGGSDCGPSVTCAARYCTPRILRQRLRFRWKNALAGEPFHEGYVGW